MEVRNPAEDGGPDSSAVLPVPKDIQSEIKVAVAEQMQLLEDKVIEIFRKHGCIGRHVAMDMQSGTEGKGAISALLLSSYDDAYAASRVKLVAEAGSSPVSWLYVDRISSLLAKLQKRLKDGSLVTFIDGTTREMNVAEEWSDAAPLPMPNTAMEAEDTVAGGTAADLFAYHTQELSRDQILHAAQQDFRRLLQCSDAELSGLCASGLLSALFSWLQQCLVRRSVDISTCVALVSAILAVRKVSNEFKDTIGNMAKPTAMQVLALLSENSDEVTAQAAATHLMCATYCDDQPLRNALCDANAADILLNAWKSNGHSGPVVGAICGAIRNITSNTSPESEKCRDAMIKAGVLEYIVASIRSLLDDPDNLGLLFSALRNFSLTDDKLRSRTFELGGLTLAMEAIRKNKHHIEMTESAFTVLRNSTAGLSEGNRQEIFKSGLHDEAFELLLAALPDTPLHSETLTQNTAEVDGAVPTPVKDRVYRNRMLLADAVCGTLRNLVAGSVLESDARRLAIGSPDNVKKIYMLLQRIDDPPAMESMCGLIRNLAFRHDALRFRQHEVGLTVLLLDMLKKNNKEHTLVSAAAGAVRNLTAGNTDVIRDVVIAEGGTDVFIDLLRAHASHPVAVETTCGALRNICVTRDDVRAKIMDKGVVPEMVTALKEHMEKSATADALCGLLRNIICGPASRKHMLVQIGAVPLIMDTLKRHKNDATLVESACGALRNAVGGDNDEDRQLVASLDAIPLLLEVLDLHIGSPIIVDTIATSLRNLAGGYCDVNREALSAGGAVAAIVRAFHRHESDAKVAEACVSAFRNIAWTSDAIRESYVPEGVIECIVDTIALHKSRPDVVDSAVTTLSKLGETSRLRRFLRFTVLAAQPHVFEMDAKVANLIGQWYRD